MSGGNKGQKSPSWENFSQEEQEEIDMAIAIADSQRDENYRRMYVSMESKLMDDYNRGMMDLKELKESRAKAMNSQAAGGPLGGSSSGYKTTNSGAAGGSSSAAKNKSSPAVGGAAGGSSARNTRAGTTGFNTNAGTQTTAVRNNANANKALAAAIDRANKGGPGFKDKKGKDREKPL